MFWDYFLFEDSHICSTDPNLACFPANPNMTTPRLDCSDTGYLEDNNITTIICYRYVFRLSQATGSALGIITIDALVIIIITLLLFKVSNGSGWNKRRAVLAIAIQIIIVAIIAVYMATIVLSLLISYTIEKRTITIMINGFLAYTTIYNPYM